MHELSQTALCNWPSDSQSKVSPVSMETVRTKIKEKMTSSYKWLILVLVSVYTYISLQQQHLLAFPWVECISDYNIDYVKVKEKKRKETNTFHSK